MSEKKIETQGRRYGRIAFYVSEIIAIMAIVLLIIDSIIEKKININFFGSLMIYQGTIFGIVWGATASSNFAPSKKKAVIPTIPGLPANKM